MDTSDREPTLIEADQPLGLIVQMEATISQGLQMDSTLAKVVDLTLALVTIRQSLARLRDQVQAMADPEAPAAKAPKSAEATAAEHAAEPRPASSNGTVKGTVAS